MDLKGKELHTKKKKALIVKPEAIFLNHGSVGKPSRNFFLPTALRTKN